MRMLTGHKGNAYDISVLNKPSLQDHFILFILCHLYRSLCHWSHLNIQMLR
jgi:hypothetical protein